VFFGLPIYTSFDRFQILFKKYGSKNSKPEGKWKPRTKWNFIRGQFKRRRSEEMSPAPGKD
jgi:hypothetical protein